MNITIKKWKQDMSRKLRKGSKKKVDKILKK